MVYEKKVKYLDYFERGMRVRGGGFVKLEMRDGTLRIELALTGLHQTDTFVRDVMLCGRNREESCGKIEICAGRGQYRQQWRNPENIGGTGIGYGELCGIRISLGGGREVSGRWQADGGTATEKWTTENETDASSGGKPVRSGNGHEKEPDEMAAEETAPGEVLREAEEKGRYKGMPAEPRATRPGETKAELSGKEAKAASAGALFEEDGIGGPAGWEGDKGTAAAWQNGGNGGAAMGAAHVEETVGDREPTTMGGELQGSSMEAEADIETWMQKGTESMMGGRKRSGGETHKEVSQRQTPDGTDDNGVGEERLRNREARPAAWGNAQPMNHGSRCERTAMAGKNQDNEANGRNGPEIIKSADRRVEWKEDGSRQRKPAGEPDKADRTSPVKLMEDKWSQLWAIYPHIRPFQDAREYLSIGPADFVLFPEAFYKAANNSFLLHGYYNYHHLLLVRMERRGEIAYYIGVPGNFYEREKQVAIMFGFESFECAEEPAQAGDFGYYMMRAQI
nr:hypothetical protein [uncultured Acetatifactor sp.]